jgi:uncharacterized SAM-binding protein YcdF (DUF218 family)
VYNVYFFLTSLLRPYTLLFLVAAAGLVYVWYRTPGARRRLCWVVVPFAGLFLLSMPFLAYLELGSLEWQYPPLAAPPEHVEALVVLGGGVRPPDATRKQAEPGEDSMYRCLYAAQLYHEVGGCPVLVSGGHVNGDPGKLSVAEVMRDFLVQLGVRPEDITVEDQSQTTYENALGCRKLLEARGVRRVVLVTDATHMLRAAHVFARQGLEVTPAPCRQLATQFEWSGLDFVPNPSAAVHSQEAFHEWVGTLWYWCQGRL